MKTETQKRGSLLTATMLSALTAITTFAQSSHARDFRRVLTCADGGAIIDVDLNQPQVAQVVIKDFRAVDFLKSQAMVRDLDLSVTHPGFPVQHSYELIFIGTQDTRLTDSGFTGIAGNEASPRFALNASFGPFQRHHYRVFLFPESGGLKLRVDEVITAFQGCTVPPTITSNGSECLGGKMVIFPAEYKSDRAHWFFPNCKSH